MGLLVGRFDSTPPYVRWGPRSLCFYAACVVMCQNYRGTMLTISIRVRAETNLERMVEKRFRKSDCRLSISRSARPAMHPEAEQNTLNKHCNCANESQQSGTCHIVGRQNIWKNMKMPSGHVHLFWTSRHIIWMFWKNIQIICFSSLVPSRWKNRSTKTTTIWANPGNRWTVVRLPINLVFHILPSILQVCWHLQQIFSHTHRYFD